MSLAAASVLPPRKSDMSRAGELGPVGAPMGVSSYHWRAAKYFGTFSRPPRPLRINGLGHYRVTDLISHWREHNAFKNQGRLRAIDHFRHRGGFARHRV